MSRKSSKSSKKFTMEGIKVPIMRMNIKKKMKQFEAWSSQAEKMLEEIIKQEFTLSPEEYNQKRLELFKDKFIYRILMFQLKELEIKGKKIISEDNLIKLREFADDWLETMWVSTPIIEDLINNISDNRKTAIERLEYKEDRFKKEEDPNQRRFLKNDIEEEKEIVKYDSHLINEYSNLLMKGQRVITKKQNEIAEKEAKQYSVEGEPTNFELSEMKYPKPSTKKVCEIYDMLRDQLPNFLHPNDIFVVTSGVSTLGISGLEVLIKKIKEFYKFTEDNDPWKEHDFISVDYKGEKFFFKFDWYGGQEGYRVVATLMKAEEY